MSIDDRYKKGFVFREIKDKVCCYKDGDRIEVVKNQYFDNDFKYCWCRYKDKNNQYRNQTVKKENIFKAKNTIKRL